MPVAEDFVANAFRVLLGREPDLVGLRHHCNSANEDILVTNLLSSAEFRARRPAVAAPDVWVWVETQFGFRMNVNLADTSVSTNILRGSFEPLEIDYIKSIVRKNDFVMDIGANIGYYTQILAQIVGENGHVYAFEALPHLCDAVRRSTRENGYANRVSIFQVALSDAAGEAEMVYAPGGNWGGAHLSFDGKTEAGYKAERVPVMTLNSLVKLTKLNFVKMDVEGAELLVVSPFAEELRRLRPVILSELHRGQLLKVSRTTPTAFIRLLKEAGYRCRILGSDSYIDRYESDDIASVIFTPD